MRAKSTPLESVRSSEFGVRENFHKGTQVATREMRNTNSEMSGPYSDPFGVRRLLEEETQDKTTNCEIRAKGRRSDDSPSIERPSSKERAILKGKQSNGWDRFGDKPAQMNGSDLFGKGVFEELGAKGWLSIEWL